MYNELREMRQQIYSLPKENRDVAKGILVYKKITTLERLDDMYAVGRSFINQYHKNWNEDKNAMKAIDKLKNYLNKENENSISGAEIELSLEKAVQAQKRLQELQQTNTRLKDLVMDKQETKIVYRDQKTESPVFTDKGDFVVAGKNPSKEEIGIMLEYSKEKFGGVLKLTGSEEFKKECALVAAERDMNIILRPEKYQQMMLEHKAELESKAMQQTEQESQQQTQLIMKSARQMFIRTRRQRKRLNKKFIWSAIQTYTNRTKGSFSIQKRLLTATLKKTRKWQSRNTKRTHIWEMDLKVRCLFPRP